MAKKLDVEYIQKIFIHGIDGIHSKTDEVPNRLSGNREYTELEFIIYFIENRKFDRQWNSIVFLASSGFT